MKLTIKQIITCLLVITTITTTSSLSAKAKTETLTMTSTLTEVQAYVNMMNKMSAKSKSLNENKLKSRKNRIEKATEENDIMHFMTALSSPDFGKPKKSSNLHSNSNSNSNRKNTLHDNARENSQKDTINNYHFKSRSSTSSLSSENEFSSTDSKTLSQNSNSNSNTNQVPETQAKDSGPAVRSLDNTEFKGIKAHGLTFEGWWTVSSREFKDYRNYPPLTLVNGTIIEIQADEKNMRYNYAANCTDDAKPPSPFSFWFRMNDINLYYSATKTDVNILGEIQWDEAVDVVELDKTVNGVKNYCFQTNDKANKNWILCNTNVLLRNRWLCRIKLLLGMPVDDKCSEVTGSLPGKPTEENKKIQPEVVIPLPSRQCNENWSYKSNGKDWECICKEGFEQSPVDLPTPDKAHDSPVKPLFQYSEAGPQSEVSTIDQLLTQGEDIELRNYDGHLTLHHNNFGKIITLDGSVFKAEEITFHTPSNHLIDGKQFPLEVSIIHYGISVGDIAKTIILSFLFEKSSGVYNQFIDDIDFFNLPNSTQKSKKISASIFIPKIFFESKENDDQVISMKPFSFYTYQGSLPFPPCTERTIHYVAAKPLRIGSTALQLFKEALKVPDQIESNGSSFDVIVSDQLPISNRATQDLRGRPVFYYDHGKYCGNVEPVKPDVKPIGHYEKMSRDATNYFFVSGNKPSGIPGAFVVPNDEAK